MLVSHKVMHPMSNLQSYFELDERRPTKTTGATSSKSVHFLRLSKISVGIQIHTGTSTPSRAICLPRTAGKEKKNLTMVCNTSRSEFVLFNNHKLELQEKGDSHYDCSVPLVLVLPSHAHRQMTPITMATPCLVYVRSTKFFLILRLS